MSPNLQAGGGCVYREIPAYNTFLIYTINKQYLEFLCIQNLESCIFRRIPLAQYSSEELTYHLYPKRIILEYFASLVRKVYSIITTPPSQEIYICVSRKLKLTINQDKIFYRAKLLSARPPAEGTTKEPMTIVDSVVRESIVKCHLVEEFVSQDVVV